MLTMRTGVQPSDLEDLVAILHDAEEDDERTRAVLTNRSYQTYTGWLDGQLVGAAVVDWRPGLDSEILYIAVDENQRGQGHGRQILEHVTAELPRHGQRLIVGTANSSLDNIAFYQRCGFRMDAVKRDYFGYVEPEVTEFDIPLRDMIVFSYELTEHLPGQLPDADAVDLEALDEVSFLLVPGSTRLASRNNAVLRAVRSLAPRSVLFDGLVELPQFSPDDEPESNSAVTGLRSMLAGADVVLFCTPEYAGSLPGSFKNLIDWTVGTGDLYQKSVAWINVAPVGRGTGASRDLARVLGYVDAQVLEPGGLQLPLDTASIGPDQEVVDEDYRDRLLRGLVGLAEAHHRRGG
jgi:chromate reductase, NAD(P)H dehydrogenase (quinone)